MYWPIAMQFVKRFPSMTQSIEKSVLQRIQSEMDRYLLEHDAPEEVRGFLRHHWAQFLTVIFLTRGNQHADWLGGWDTLNALLWSLAPKSSRSETEKMLHMLPTLLSRLQAGCAVVGMSTLERDALFERLAMMHAAVARAGLRCRDQAEVGITRLAESSDVEGAADLAVLNPPTYSTIELDPPPETGMPLPMPQLNIGDRVLFRASGQVRTLYLNWISPAGGMYLFGNEHGLDAMTLTRARLAERFRHGQAALVCD